MDVLLNEEQRLLKDSVDRFIGDNYTFEQRRAWTESPEGTPETNWTAFAEMGWLGLPLPEAHGGFGGSLSDVAVLMEGFGRGLVVDPYIPTVLFGAGLLAVAGTAEQQAELLPSVAEGKLKLAVAHVERQARFNLADVKTEAATTPDGFCLNGQKSVVFGAPQADMLLVSARAGGNQTNEAGISLFLVPNDTPGLTLRPYRTQDAHLAADIALQNVEVPSTNLIGKDGVAFAAIEQVAQRTIIALCAEATGAMEALNELTFGYLKTRTQFGTPIGSFQSLQHHASDMLMAHKITRAMIHRMAREAEASDTTLARCATALKVQTGKAGKLVGQNAIQLHGGIGMTDEYAAGHYFKRLTMIDMMFGNAEHHLSRFAAARK